MVQLVNLIQLIMDNKMNISLLFNSINSQIIKFNNNIKIRLQKEVLLIEIKI